MKYDISSNETVSRAVVTAVSTLEGRDPASLEPLDDTVDRTALNTIFARRTDGGPRYGGRISFIYSHSRVTVDNNEYIEVTSAV